MKIIGISSFSIAGLFLLLWVTYAVAQGSCPSWAQQRRTEIAQQGAQLGFESGMTGQPIDPARLDALNQEWERLPKACTQQSQASDEASSHNAICSQKVHEFNQCRHDFNKRVAAGANPAYTCQPPRGCGDY